jgi:hypothetical protein
MQNVFTKKSYIIFAIAILSAIPTLAQKGGGGGGKFSFGAMLLMGTGKMGNGLTDAPDRDMIFTPVGLFAGVNIKKFRLGLNYEYMIAGQTAEPATVGNTNVSGTGTAPGVRLEYYDGKNSFGLVYRLSDTYNLDKITFAGSKATYKGTGGITVQFTRQLKNKIGFVIDYTTETFSDSLTTGNVKWNRIGAGIIFSNFAGK